MSNDYKKRHERYLFIGLIFFILLCGASSSTYTEGIFWSRLDDGLNPTIVLQNTSDNVLIGRNDTTEYTLEIEGQTLFNGSVFLNFKNLDFGITSGDGRMNENVEGINLQLGGSDNFTVRGYGDTNFVWSTGYPYPTPKFIIDENGNIFVNGELDMTGSDIQQLSTINFTDDAGSYFGNDPNYPGYWGAGNQIGAFWLPQEGDLSYYIGYGNSTEIPLLISNSANVPIHHYKPESSSNYFSQTITGNKELIWQFYPEEGLDDSIFNFKHVKGAMGGLKDIRLQFNSISGSNTAFGNITYDGSDDSFIIEDADVNVDGGNITASELHSSNGWTGTFNVTEGEVTVIDGIITGVDWD